MFVAIGLVRSGPTLLSTEPLQAGVDNAGAEARIRAAQAVQSRLGMKLMQHRGWCRLSRVEMAGQSHICKQNSSFAGLLQHKQACKEVEETFARTVDLMLRLALLEIGAGAVLRS